MMKAAALFQAPAAFMRTQRPEATGCPPAPPGGRRPPPPPAAGWPMRSPRMRRALRAMALNFEGVKRERMDALVGCSNSPDVIMRLKNDYRINVTKETIYCRDRDGCPSHFAVYSLPPQERMKVQAWMATDSWPQE
jgi:hypothetical protein